MCADFLGSEGMFIMPEIAWQLCDGWLAMLVTVGWNVRNILLLFEHFVCVSNLVCFDPCVFPIT
jgi:hypothetical protein